ncbi:MAG: SUF system NifU family Fe-S cluster assembly protein [Gammaproteobacteria bacterium]|nr:SUF system NifU family Fe-S cluster assembly protein [Gammaproteobacteria bacterium]MDH5618398.1 SUF system NifU family Fe-S cluster assembly protein [Gammaproteobacteria bacterium]
MTATARDMQDLYRELVLDHSRNPRHFGRLEDATHTADGINPLCGDKLRLYLRVDDAGNIESSSFEGSGCAISVASASLLTDAVTGLPVEQARRCCATVAERLAGDESAELASNLEKLRALDGVRQYPSRIKCATLAWHALRSALNHDAVPATTE